MNPVRSGERKLVGVLDRLLDAPAPTTPLVCRVGATYLRARHRLLHRAALNGWLWLTSAWRLAIAVALKPGDCFVDLGANLGRVSQEAAWRVGPEGSVHSIEPSPSIADRLERRMERLGLSQVTISRYAVGAEPGKGTFYEYAHRDGGASSLRPQPHVGAPPDIERQVRVVTVDEYLEEQGVEQVAVIKIDVEGAEVEALEGARRTLSAQPRPVLVVEAAPVTQSAFGQSVQTLLDTLHGMGYSACASRPHGLVTVERETDLPVGSRREDLLALHVEDHRSLERRLVQLATRRRSR